MSTRGKALERRGKEDTKAQLFFFFFFLFFFFFFPTVFFFFSFKFHFILANHLSLKRGIETQGNIGASLLVVVVKNTETHDFPGVN